MVRTQSFMKISFETNIPKYVFYWTEINAVCIYSETDWLFGLIKYILLESSHHPLPPGEIRERLERRCQHHWKAEEVKESSCSCLVSVSGLMLALLLYLLCVDGVQDEWDLCWLNFHDLNKRQHHHGNLCVYIHLEENWFITTCVRFFLSPLVSSLVLKIGPTW